MLYDVALRVECMGEWLGWPGLIIMAVTHCGVARVGVCTSSRLLSSAHSQHTCVCADEVADRLAKWSSP